MGPPGSASRAADTITVHVDHAQIMRLPERAATLVIGNPLIADVSLQKGGVLVITGKGYGATNLMMLDRNGNPVSERLIRVVGANDGTVFVYRQIERQTLSCTPDCEPRANLGDAGSTFGPTLDQIGARNGGALSSAAAGAAGGGGGGGPGGSSAAPPR